MASDVEWTPSGAAKEFYTTCKILLVGGDTMCKILLVMKTKLTNANILKLSTVDRIAFQIHMISGVAPFVTGDNLKTCLDGIRHAATAKQSAACGARHIAAYLILKNVFEIEDEVNNSVCLFKVVMNRLTVCGGLDNTTPHSILETFA